MDTPVYGIYSKHRYPAPIFSNLIGHKFTDKSIVNVNPHYRMKFGSDAVLTESLNLMNLGLASAQTLDELWSVFIPTTRIGKPKDGSNWLPNSHNIGEVTADRVIRTGSEQDYNAKTAF